MAFADKKGITVASGFKLQAPSPIDARFSCSTVEDLAELVSLNAAYPGLQVYCEADTITYKYTGTDWIKMDNGSSIDDTLGNYLPLSGGTLSGLLNLEVGLSFIYQGGNAGYIQYNTVNNDNLPRLNITAVDGVDINGVYIGPDVDNSKIIAHTIAGNVLEIGNYDTGTSALYVGENLLRTTYGASTVSLTDGGIQIDGMSSGITIVNSSSISFNGTKLVHTNDASELTVTADKFVGYLDGLALAASGLNQQVLINGTAFDGTTDITTETWGNSRTFTLKGGATGSVAVDGSSDVELEVTAIDGSKITGIIPLTSIPKGAQENVVNVANMEAMYSLTADQIQLGDVVRVLDNGNGETVMYYVVDGSNLSNENGYAPFAAGMAASVPVSGVEGLEAWANGIYLRTDGGGDGGSSVSVDTVNFGNGINISSTNAQITSSDSEVGIDYIGSASATFDINGFDTITSNASTISFSNATINATEFIGNFTGNASSASALNVARNIALSGGVTGEATAFDGTNDITIPVSEVSASALYVPDGDVLILDGNAA